MGLPRRATDEPPLDPETVFTRIRHIGPEDCDELGHVNNAVWVRFVAEVAQAHSEALGLDLAAYQRIGGLWIVRRHEIDYHQPAVPGDEVVEETWVADMQGARSTRRARFSRADDGTLLLASATRWAFVDATTGRPRRIPAELLERFPGAPADGTGPPGAGA